MPILCDARAIRRKASERRSAPRPCQHSSGQRPVARSPKPGWCRERCAAFFRAPRPLDRARRNAEIGGDLPAFTDDISAREAALVLHCAVAQPVVQRRLAAIEGRKIVFQCQGNGPTNGEKPCAPSTIPSHARHPTQQRPQFRSQRGRVVERAHEGAVAFGVECRTAADRAARRSPDVGALSIMNSVRVLPRIAAASSISRRVRSRSAD